MGLFSLFGASQTAAAPALDSDDAYPLHAMDDMDVHHGTPIVLMRFNDVLDAKKLNASLVKTIEIGDWKKAGGRFHRDAKGHAQLRVPAAFTPERPAVQFSQLKFDIGIEEHPLARQLPRATEKLSLHPSAGYFAEFCWAPDAPGTLPEFLRCDKPPLGLRVTNFLDATLVAVSWSHSLTDAGGFREIVSAWCKVLAGREDEVGRVLSAREDATKAMSDTESPDKKENLWGDSILAGWKLTLFIIGLLWRVFWQHNVLAHTLFLPASFIAQLRREAEQSLPEGTFTSDGDILCAWLSRLIVSLNKCNGPVTIMNFVDIRSRVPSVFQKDGVYLQNLTMASCTFTRGSELLSDNLGTVALNVRESIAAQTSEPQIKSFYRLVMPSIKAKGTPPVFGRDFNMRMVPVSNWSKAKFIESIDFSPAIIWPGDSRAERQNPPGKMEYILTYLVKVSPMVRDTAIIMGKDHSKNYWVTLYLVDSLKNALEEHIRDIGKTK